jgi:hypothetical protein
MGRQASEAEIMAALTGHYRPEPVFVLQQNLERFDAYQRQLAACDAAIEAHVHTLATQAPAPAGPLPRAAARWLGSRAAAASPMNSGVPRACTWTSSGMKTSSMRRAGVVAWRA